MDYLSFKYNLFSAVSNTYKKFCSYMSDLTEKIQSLWEQSTHKHSFFSGDRHQGSSLLITHDISILTSLLSDPLNKETLELNNRPTEIKMNPPPPLEEDEELFFDCLTEDEELFFDCLTGEESPKKARNIYTKNEGSIHFVLQQEGTLSFYKDESIDNSLLFTNSSGEETLFPILSPILENNIHTFSGEVSATGLVLSQEISIEISSELAKKDLVKMGISLPLPDRVFLHIPKEISVIRTENNGNTRYQFSTQQVSIKDSRGYRIFYVQGLEYTSTGNLFAIDLQSDWWTITPLLALARKILAPNRTDGWIVRPNVFNTISFDSDWN